MGAQTGKSVFRAPFVEKRASDQQLYKVVWFSKRKWPVDTLAQGERFWRNAGSGSMHVLSGDEGSHLFRAHVGQNQAQCCRQTGARIFLRGGGSDFLRCALHQIVGGE